MPLLHGTNSDVSRARARAPAAQRAVETHPSWTGQPTRRGSAVKKCYGLSRSGLASSHAPADPTKKQRAAMSKTASIPSSQSTTTDTDVQRRTAKRKALGVIDLIFGNTTARETARIHGLTRAGWCAGAWNSSLRLPRACAATRATSPNSKKSSAKSSWPRSAN